MLEVLNCKEPYNCLKSLPFEKYFVPLQEAYDASVEELVRLYLIYPLGVQYNIPENEKMHQTICETIKQDVTVQWLASTPLKRD